MNGYLRKLAALGVTAVLLAYLGVTQDDGAEASAPMEPTFRAEAPEALPLPLAVSGTGLTAVGLARYDGPALDGGGERWLSGAGGLVIENRGESHLAAGEVVLEGSGEVYCFPFSDLPPGGKILALEAKERPCPETAFTACYGYEAALEKAFPQGLEVRETGLCGLLVTNLGDSPMEALRLRYKGYDEAAGIYIGGGSYTLEVGALAAGETKEVYPYRYVSGYSQVVGAEGYAEVTVSARSGTAPMPAGRRR